MSDFPWNTPSKMVNYSVIAILLFGIFFGYAYYFAISSPYRISSEETTQRIRSNQIDLVVDVRSQLERDTIGFYPHSMHVPNINAFPEQEPDKSTRILVYCNTGQRARIATEQLRKMGYNHAVYMVGIPTAIAPM